MSIYYIILASRSTSYIYVRYKVGISVMFRREQNDVKVLQVNRTNDKWFLFFWSIIYGGWKWDYMIMKAKFMMCENLTILIWFEEYIIPRLTHYKFVLWNFYRKFQKNPDRINQEGKLLNDWMLKVSIGENVQWARFLFAIYLSCSSIR